MSVVLDADKAMVTCPFNKCHAVRMSVVPEADNAMVTCPFNKCHAVRYDRLQYHIIRCKKTYRGNKVPCPYNATEYVEPSAMVHHLSVCRNRMDRECQFYSSLKNNCLVEPVQAPFVHEGIPDVEENWGVE